MALGASVYKLVFDTQGLQNVTASRRELALSKKIMEETAPVVDKLATAEANLDRLVAKDLISTEQRNQALSKVKSELTGQADAVNSVTSAHLNGIPVIGKYISSLSSIEPASLLVTAATAALAVGVSKVRDQIGQIDELLNQSENLGIAADQFQRMSAAAHLADIETAQFSSGIETMMVNISKAAADPGGKIGKVFKLAELDANALKKSRPEEAFEKVTKAIHEIGNADDRIRSAKGIFGNPDFMRIDSSHIEKANDNIEKMGASIDGVKSDKFREMDAALDSMNQNVDLFWKNITFQASPAIEKMAVRAEKLVQAAKSFGDTPLFKFVMFQQKVLSDALTASPVINAAIDDIAIGSAKPQQATGSSASSSSKPISERMLDTADIDDATDSVASLTKELQKQVKELEDAAEYAGYAKEEIVLLKLAEEGASATVRDAAHASASRVLELKRQTEATKEAAKTKQAIDTFTESLQLQGETAEVAARRLADLKLKNDGVGESMRELLMFAFDISEANKKTEAATKKHADAIDNLSESLGKQEAKLQGFNSATGKYEDRVRAGERAVLAWQLAHEKAGPAITAATLKNFDATTALEKRQKATDALTKAEENFRKLIRQAGMTDQQKELDDLKTEMAGLNDEQLNAQLKVNEALQKEAMLRGAIKQELTATGFAMKANSREAAEAFAKANQAAVIATSIRDQERRMKESGAPVGEQLAGVPKSGAPNALPLRDPRADAERAAKLRGEVKERIAKDRDPLADQETRARFMGEANERKFAAMEAREKLMKKLQDDKAAKALADANVREQISNRLNGVTATPQPTPPTIVGTTGAPQAKEQLKATEKTNALLGKILEKPAVTLQIEEVTL